jgi:hypothetical protein
VKDCLLQIVLCKYEVLVDLVKPKEAALFVPQHEMYVYIFLLKLLEDSRFQIIEPWHIFKDLLTALFRSLLLPFIPVMVKGKSKGKVYPITGDEGPGGDRGIALLFL